MIINRTLIELGIINEKGIYPEKEYVKLYEREKGA